MNDTEKKRIKELLSSELNIPPELIRFTGEVERLPSTENPDFLESLAGKLHKTYGIPENKLRRTIRDYKRWWDKQFDN